MGEGTYQVIELIFLIQCRYELTLNVLFRLVHEQMHDGLGDGVLDRLLHDGEVRCDQELDNFRFNEFTGGWGKIDGE